MLKLLKDLGAGDLSSYARLACYVRIETRASTLRPADSGFRPRRFLISTTGLTTFDTMVWRISFLIGTGLSQKQ